MCERWVGNWTDCNKSIPNSSVFSCTSFSFCWAAQSGVLRAQPSLGAGSHYSILSPTNSISVCGTGLYNCLMTTCFLWALHLHPIQPVHSQGYTLISSTRCTCYLHRGISYLTAQLRVNMQQKCCLLLVLENQPWGRNNILWGSQQETSYCEASNKTLNSS